MSDISAKSLTKIDVLFLKRIVRNFVRKKCLVKFGRDASSSGTLCIALVAVARRDIISSRRSRFPDFRKVSDVVWPSPRCIIAETRERATLTTHVGN